MRILIIGSGAREHALAWKISRSPLLTKMFVWPGNPAIHLFTEKLAVKDSVSYEELAKTAKSLGIDLVVCGPEVPLAQGLSNVMKKIGIPFFGPSKEAAAIESSKSFAKDLMRSAGIPTAEFKVAFTEKQCRDIAETMYKRTGAAVIKASGLAAGKGVFVCQSKEDIDAGISRLYGSSMKEAAETVVIEELLIGSECSYFSFLGPEHKHNPHYATSLGFAVDYKRLKDGHLGPNTGGMGGYAPVPWLPKNADSIMQTKVIDPLVKAFKKGNLDYCGWIFVGVMWGEEGPKVFEFNARLGDPETQSLVLYDQSDWLPIIAVKAGLDIPESTFSHKKSSHLDPKSVVSVVMASHGYPYGEGDEDEVSTVFSKDLFLDNSESLCVFGASLKSSENHITTGKGRVLTVSAMNTSFKEARDMVYEKIGVISSSWKTSLWRRDIAQNI